MLKSEDESSTVCACVCACMCMCWQQRGSNVIWVPKQNSSHVLVPSEGEDEQSIHSSPLSLQSEGENCSHGFPCYLPHCHLTPSVFSSPSLPTFPSFTHLISAHLSLSLSLFQEWISNTTTGYHWYGARNWDDQTLWTCQQICQQHQQATGCSGGERGEIL